MFCSVGHILSGNTAHQGVGGVAVCEKRADGEEDFGDGQCWAPVVFQNVQANNTLTVDITVIDSCPKCHLWRLEGVLRCEGDIEEEHAALVHGARRPEDGGPPLVDVVAFGTSAAVGRRV